MKNSIPKYSAFLVILALGGCLQSEYPVLFEKDRETISGLADTWELVQVGDTKVEPPGTGFLKVTELPNKEYSFEAWEVGDNGFRGDLLDLLSSFRINEQLAYLQTGPSTYLLVVPRSKEKVGYIEVAVTRSYNPLHFRDIEIVTFQVLGLASSGIDDVDPSLSSILQRWGFTVDRSGSEGSEPTYELRGNLTSAGLKDLFSDAAFDKFLEKETMFSFKKLSDGVNLGKPRPTEEVAYSGGDIYVGELQDGKKHGHGTYTHSGGDVYEGEWREDKKHGHGTYTHSGGAVYEGEWRENKMHGHGTYTFVGGNIYVGEWREDKMHGHGTYTNASGDVDYEGEWREGKPIEPVSNRQSQEQTEVKQQAEPDRQQLEEENRQLRQQLEAKRQAEIRRQQAIKRRRVCGAWTCVQLEDGTVLLQTQDGSAWVYRDGGLAPRNIWPRAQ